MPTKKAVRKSTQFKTPDKIQVLLTEYGWKLLDSSKTSATFWHPKTSLPERDTRVTVYADQWVVSNEKGSFEEGLNNYPNTLLVFLEDYKYKFNQKKPSKRKVNFHVVEEKSDIAELGPLSDAIHKFAQDKRAKESSVPPSITNVGIFHSMKVMIQGMAFLGTFRQTNYDLHQDIVNLSKLLDARGNDIAALLDRKPPAQFEIEVDAPGDPAVGIFSTTDIIRIHLDSGEPGGGPGEFAKFLSETLASWYDCPVENIWVKEVE